MTQPRKAITWQVVQQTPGMGRTSFGQYVHGVNVTWQASNAMSGTVFVPDDQYSEDTTRNLIDLAVRRMLGVHGLAGQV